MIVVGCDEVGRGCLSGDCWAAAVAFPNASPPEGLRDSKSLTAAQRERLATEIARVGVIGVGRASVEEIDRLNILNAALLAMTRAVNALHLEISAASIVAKVYRDRYMNELDRAYPGYGWAQNKGYGTRDHLEALNRLGVTPHHRLSFGPVRQGTLAL